MEIVKMGENSLCNFLHCTLRKKLKAILLRPNFEYSIERKVNKIPNLDKFEKILLDSEKFLHKLNNLLGFVLSMNLTTFKENY